LDIDAFGPIGIERMGGIERCVEYGAEGFEQRQGHALGSVVNSGGWGGGGNDGAGRPERGQPGIVTSTCRSELTKSGLVVYAFESIIPRSTFGE
jgi:hypothetical protein